MKSVEKSVLAGALAAALGGGPALAQNVPGSQLTTTTPGRDAPIASSMRSGTSLARVDASFLKNAAESDATEIAASRLALQKSNNEQVKQFAQQMVTEHGRTSDALTALAQKKGVVVSTDPSLIDKGKLKLLAALDGVSFDKRYASSVGVSAHESAVKLFRRKPVAARTVK